MASNMPSNTLTPKAVREALCDAQSALYALAGRADHPSTVETYRAHAATLGTLIREIDKARPLGPDGKHGNGERCTESCGCDQHTGHACPGHDAPWVIMP